MELDYCDFVSIENLRYKSADNIVLVSVHRLLVGSLGGVVASGAGDRLVGEHLLLIHPPDVDVVAGLIVTSTENINQSATALY